MSFSRRGRPLAEEEKSTDAAKARARAMELLAGQELSSGQLYERLGRKFTQPTAAAVVAEMVERQYVDDERYARTRAHGLLAARKSRRAAAQDLRQKGLDAHIESGADITCVCTESGQFVENATYFTVNEAGRITETRCAPHKASGCRSLEIYLLSRDLLISLVDECAAQDKYSFRSDVLCARGDKLDLRAFLWDGFAAQLRTVQEYYERSMQLLDPAIRSELLCAERPILAKEDDEAASYIAPDSRCVNSLIADGCQIEGNVEGSILFPGVKVGKGSQVKNCILFKNTVVEDGVTLGCVIADKDVHDFNTRYEAERAVITAAKGGK